MIAEKSKEAHRVAKVNGNVESIENDIDILVKKILA